MRRWRRLRRVLARLIAAAIIFFGVLVATLSQLLPLLQARPQAVADWLALRVEQPVSLRAVNAAWNGRGVLLELGGLRIGSGQGPTVEQARLQIDVLGGWIPGRPLTSLRLSGPSLQLVRDDQERWQVRGLGLGPAADGQDQLGLIERLGELVLDRASLSVSDPGAQLQWSLERVDARLRTLGGRVRVGALAYQNAGPPLQIQLDFESGLQTGQAYLRAPDMRLRDWLPDGMPDTDVRVEFEVWMQAEQSRLTALQWRGGLRGHPSASLAQGPVMGSPGDALVLPELDVHGDARFESARSVWTVASAQADDWVQFERAGEDWSVVVADLHLARWLPWMAEFAALPEREPRSWSRDLLQLAPQGVLRGLRVRGQGDTPSSLEGWLEGGGLAPFGNRPGFTGLNVAFDGDAQRVRWRVAADAFRFDWPVGLRAALSPRMSGSGLLWRSPQRGWCASAHDLQFDDPEFRLRSEGDLCWSAQGPFVDLRVDVAPAQVVAAKKFWIMHRMSERSVQWLDNALRDGEVRAGRLLLHGELRDWPFRGQRGRMQAVAELAGVELAYHPAWPLGKNLGGAAWFINDGMEVALSAEVDGIEVERVTGGIDRFGDAVLDLQIQTHADGGELLRLLRGSPLWPNLQAAMQSIAIHGRGAVDLGLNIPLKPGSPPARVRGEVDFERADLRHAEWGIAFDAAHGAVEFSERGVRVREMAVVHSGRSAVFDLNVGSFVQDPALRVESALAGRLDLRALIDTQPELNWLRPWVEGEAEFRIDLSIPDQTDPPRLRLRSDLVGVSLDLPAPLKKSAATPMPMDLQVGLLSGRQAVDLQLGELMRLLGATGDSPAFTGIATFGGAEPAERPEQGIAVVGQVPVLDIDGWLALALHNSGEGLVRSVDLATGELSVLGRSFAETRIDWTRRDDGQHVRLAGTQLDGTIEIPAAEDLAQRGITARFGRLHWPAAPTVEGGAPASTVDPRTVPPLHLHIEDFHLAGARLGDTRLETFPDLEGMRIEQFDARSEALQLSARGDWRRGEAGETSRFTAEFAAENLGAMLAALGFSDLVEGGQSLVSLDAEWAGAPSAFALQRSTGTLELSVGKGQIPNVKPGAGRLLGLLSLGQIPRRLALDFSDFFGEGLAFDGIEGVFRLADGTATTDGLVIDGPAAEIRIRGVTGLATQSYEQTMEVLPRAGNVLPIVGALAAGPAGAALGAVAQAVLQNPFKQMTRTLYSVRGPWDEPQIEVIERGPARNAPDLPVDPPAKVDGGAKEEDESAATTTLDVAEDTPEQTEPARTL